MLISIFDPSLLIYDFDDWKHRKEHCYKRFKALTDHRSVINREEISIALSDEFLCHILKHFPWDRQLGEFPELRDFKLFLLQDFSKALTINVENIPEISIKQKNIVCLYVDSDEVTNSWKQLLYCIINSEEFKEHTSIIAGWDPGDDFTELFFIEVVLENQDKSDDNLFHFPFVWNEDSWNEILSEEECWPDLKKCVDRLLTKESSYSLFGDVRSEPIPFKASERFLKSLNRYCNKNKNLRSLFIKALAKRIYGIMDESLGDESFRGMRRFRVTKFWRVHYKEENGEIILNEFGIHDMGMDN